MKARHSQAALIAALLAGVSLAGPVAAGAQQPNNRGYTRTPDPNAPKIMISTFRSGTDKKLGADVADAIRGRMNNDFGAKQLTVISGPDIATTLKASGFDPADPLQSNDARELGRQLRADYYLEGVATRTGAGVHVEPRLVLVRNTAPAQPLPAADGAKAGDVARSISTSVKAAFAQLDAEKACVTASQSKQYPQAIAAAQRGVAAYPQSTLARLCMLSAYHEMHDTASVIRVGEEIRAIDPKSRLALQYLAEAYDQKNDDDKAVDVYTQLVAADPTNSQMVDLAVRRITGTGHPERAFPIIRTAVEQNPGDPSLLRTQMLIQLAGKDYKGGIATGEELVKIDTSAADTTYFTRIAAAYAADSQPQKAAETIARGIQKFPNNQGMKVVYAQALRGAGQNQQALVALRQIVATNPKTPGVYPEIARIQVDMKQPDSALMSLRMGLAAGDSASTVAPYALSIGNAMYRAANASKAPADFQNAIRTLQFADSLSENNNAKFLIGASAVSLAQQQLTEARTAKSCPGVKTAQGTLSLAQLNLPKGMQAFPEPTKQLLGATAQLQPYADALQKQLCK